MEEHQEVRVARVDDRTRPERPAVEGRAPILRELVLGVGDELRRDPVGVDRLLEHEGRLETRPCARRARHVGAIHGRRLVQEGIAERPEELPVLRGAVGAIAPGHRIGWMRELPEVDDRRDLQWGASVERDIGCVRRGILAPRVEGGIRSGVVTACCQDDEQHDREAHRRQHDTPLEDGPTEALGPR